MDAIQTGAMRMRFECKLTAATRYDDGAGVHVAWCPALDIFTQGETEAQAKLALEDAIAMYLKHCYRRGILESLLQGRGFEPTDVPPSKTETGESGEYISVRPMRDEVEAGKSFGALFPIEVPLELIMNGAGGLGGINSTGNGAERCPS